MHFLLPQLMWILLYCLNIICLAGYGQFGLMMGGSSSCRERKLRINGAFQYAASNRS